MSFLILVCIAKMTHQVINFSLTIFITTDLFFYNKHTTIFLSFFSSSVSLFMIYDRVLTIVENLIQLRLFFPQFKYKRYGQVTIFGPKKIFLVQNTIAKYMQTCIRVYMHIFSSLQTKPTTKHRSHFNISSQNNSQFDSK